MASAPIDDKPVARQAIVLWHDDISAKEGVCVLRLYPADGGETRIYFHFS